MKQTNVFCCFDFFFFFFKSRNPAYSVGEKRKIDQRVKALDCWGLGPSERKCERLLYREHNQTIKSFIISHLAVAWLGCWSRGLDSVKAGKRGRQQPSIMSDYAV